MNLGLAGKIAILRARVLRNRRAAAGEKFAAVLPFGILPAFCGVPLTENLPGFLALEIR